MTLSDYARPTLNESQSSIVHPLVVVNKFELKQAFLQMGQQSTQFHGLPDEDLNNHIRGFLKVCVMLKINNVSNNAIRL